MKRIILAAALAALVATPALGHAAKPKRIERKVTFNYTGTCIVGIDGANGGNTACPTSSVHQVVKKGEAYVKFSAKDTTGRKIGLTQFTPGAYADTSKAYCGGITKAQKVKAGAKWSLATLGNPTCESLPTTGTITIVFSNLP